MKRMTPVEFQTMILGWWKDNARDLPWRRTRDPYRILVSEVMLQQTQVSRVIPKYAEFMGMYPDVGALAQAKTADVIRIWQGLGYNRRAVNLRACTIAVRDAHDGVFPDSETALMGLPGIGIYTARAVLVFAFGQNIAFVDTNVRKIITHYYFRGKNPSEREIQAMADRLLPKGRAWEWHQALMDFGAAHAPLFRDQGLVRKQKPFRESARFVRGAVVDILREGKVDEKMLLERMEAINRSSATPQEILAALIRDGLIKRSQAGIISLP